MGLKKFVQTSFFLKFFRDLNLFVKFIGQWIPSNKGPGITRDISKTHLNFQYSTKNGN